jgi:hypothetical protein
MELKLDHTPRWNVQALLGAQRVHASILFARSAASRTSPR